MSMKPLSLLLLLTLILSACGFHLRGSQQKTARDIATVFIRINAADRVATEVRAQLGNAGVRITNSLQEAEYILGLSQEAIRRSVLSVSATTGKVEEYQLVLSVTMNVGKPEQDALLADETIRLTRDYAFDEDTVLGKATEEQLLEEELVRQAAARIMRKLNAATRDN